MMMHSFALVLVVLAVLAQVHATSYQLTVKMSSDTLVALKKQGYRMYVFKGVQATCSDLLPTVWLKEERFMDSTTIAWTDENYKGYITLSDAKSGAVIDSITSVALTAGQTAEVDPDGYGALSVTSYPDDENYKYYLLNQSKKPFTAGLSQPNGQQKDTPLCAITLHGNDVLEIVPLQRIFIAFSTDVYNTGTVLAHSNTGGLVIDMSANPVVSVSYDVDKGWNFGNAPYATRIPPKQKFVSFLNVQNTPAPY